MEAQSSKSCSGGRPCRIVHGDCAVRPNLLQCLLEERWPRFGDRVLKPSTNRHRASNDADYHLSALTAIELLEQRHKALTVVLEGRL